MSRLANTLRQRREERGIAQVDLAERVGVTQQTVSRWESGEALPRPRRLVQLAEILGLSPMSLQREAGYVPAAPDDQAEITGGPDLQSMTERELFDLLQGVVEALRERRQRGAVRRRQ